MKIQRRIYPHRKSFSPNTNSIQYCFRASWKPRTLHKFVARLRCNDLQRQTHPLRITSTLKERQTHAYTQTAPRPGHPKDPSHHRPSRRERSGRSSERSSRPSTLHPCTLLGIAIVLLSGHSPLCFATSPCVSSRIARGAPPSAPLCVFFGPHLMQYTVPGTSSGREGKQVTAARQAVRGSSPHRSLPQQPRQSSQGTRRTASGADTKIKDPSGSFFMVKIVSP